MNDPDPNASKPKKPGKPLTREERLAAALRENLRKRKSQDRGREDASPAEVPPTGLSSREDT
ncbi:hypothetical protein ACFSM5_18730 [Lacibacterium aquatile]|uniref:Uncharacterized protein n=1 Tax=Lacibacterium aquatile TaxID=1168082 RepID=A0ABW5DW47_9PROT